MPQQIIYIHREFAQTWERAAEQAEAQYGPRQLSRYVSEAVAQRLAREAAEDALRPRPWDRGRSGRAIRGGGADHSL